MSLHTACDRGFANVGYFAGRWFIANIGYVEGVF